MGREGEEVREGGEGERKKVTNSIHMKMIDLNE